MLTNMEKFVVAIKDDIRKVPEGVKTYKFKYNMQGLEITDKELMKLNTIYQDLHLGYISRVDKYLLLTLDIERCRMFYGGVRYVLLFYKGSHSVLTMITGRLLMKYLIGGNYNIKFNMLMLSRVPFDAIVRFDSNESLMNFLTSVSGFENIFKTIKVNFITKKINVEIDNDTVLNLFPKPFNLADSNILDIETIINNFIYEKFESKK